MHCASMCAKRQRRLDISVPFDSNKTRISAKTVTMTLILEEKSPHNLLGKGGGDKTLRNVLNFLKVRRTVISRHCTKKKNTTQDNKTKEICHRRKRR